MVTKGPKRSWAKAKEPPQPELDFFSSHTFGEETKPSFGWLLGGEDDAANCESINVLIETYIRHKMYRTVLCIQDLFVPIVPTYLSMLS